MAAIFRRFARVAGGSAEVAARGHAAPQGRKGHHAGQGETDGSHVFARRARENMAAAGGSLGVRVRELLIYIALMYIIRRVA